MRDDEVTQKEGKGTRLISCLIILRASMARIDAKGGAEAGGNNWIGQGRLRKKWWSAQKIEE
jgi:hypothetical protein